MEFVLFITAIVSFIFLYALLKKEFIRQKLKEPGLLGTTKHESKLTGNQQPATDNQQLATGNQQDVTVKKPGDFVQQAASSCLHLPLIYLFMSLITSNTVGQFRFASGIIILLLMIVGIIMAVIAMVSYRSHGDKKILKKGIAGFLINGVIIYITLAIAIGAFHTTRKRQEIIKTMQKNMDDSVKIVERSLQDEDIGEQQLEVLDKGIKNLRDLSATSSHEEAKTLKIFAKAIEHTREPLTEYTFALSEFNKIGSIETAGINSVDDINNRLELLNKYEEANENLDAAFNVIEDNLRKGLFSESATPGKTDKYISLWKQRSRPDIVRKIRDTDRRVIKEYRSILKIYKTYWGKWFIDSETGELIFENDLAVTEYNKHIRSIDSIANEQKTLQKEILTSLKNGLKRTGQREDTN